MSENERPYRRYLFTVRFWRQEPSSGQAKWWGRVQSATDGERRAFLDWPELVAFFVAKLGEIEDDDK
jgi:hypothetical protein